MPENPFRVALIEEVALIRAAVACLLGTWPELELVAALSSREEGLILARTLAPSLLLVSVRATGAGMAEFITSYKNASPPTLVIGLGEREDSRTAAEAIRCGCHGYASRDQDEGKLRHVLSEVGAGRYAVTPGVDVPSAFLRASQPLSPLDALSSRERQVFSLLAEGAKVRRIGEMLGLSPKTVDSYRASLMRKLNLDDFAALIRLAMELERSRISAPAAKSAGVARD